MSQRITPRLFNEHDAGCYTARSAGWLRNQRVKDSKAVALGQVPDGPVWLTIGNRVYYERTALDSWIASVAQPCTKVDRPALVGAQTK